MVGLHSVKEALKVRPEAVKQLLVRSESARAKEIVPLRQMAERRGVRLELVTKSHLDRIADGHQGLAAQVTTDPQWSFSELREGEPCTLLALDRVQDPHNLGAILRTCWLFGARAVLVPADRAASLTPTVSKVASGAAEHVPILMRPNFVRELESLKHFGFWIYGLSHEATTSLWQVRFPERCVLVLGSEGVGIRSTVARLCDESLAIPQRQSEASLNVSVAAGVGLAEIARQRSLTPS